MSELSCVVLSGFPNNFADCELSTKLRSRSWVNDLIFYELVSASNGSISNPMKLDLSGISMFSPSLHKLEPDLKPCSGFMPFWKVEFGNDKFSDLIGVHKNLAV